MGAGRSEAGARRASHLRAEGVLHLVCNYKDGVEGADDAGVGEGGEEEDLGERGDGDRAEQRERIEQQRVELNVCPARRHAAVGTGQACGPGLQGCAAGAAGSIRAAVQAKGTGTSFIFVALLSERESEF